MRRYNIGGSATINGVIMINNSTGKVVKSFRDKDGKVYVSELTAFSKAMAFYKAKIERFVYKIPALSELFKILLMLFISIFSLLSGIIKKFSFKERWSIKGTVSLLVFLLGLYVFLFMDEYLTLVILPILVVFFNKRIALILKYHGAEHKCINMYENIYDISNATIENAGTFSRTHLRCGTNMIFILIPLILIYYFVVEQYLMLVFGGGVLELLGSIILLGICIELFKLFQKPLMRWIFKPGVFIQKYITTKEPEYSHLEVALTALKAAISE